MVTHKPHKIVNFSINLFSTPDKLIGTISIIQIINIYIFVIKSNISNILHINRRSINYPKYSVVYIDPYSMIGEVGTTQKSYKNIKKLIDFLGIKYE